MRASRQLVTIVIGVTVLPMSLNEHGLGKETIQVRIDGQDRQGTLLARSPDYAYLLGRDGRLWIFAAGQLQGARLVNTGFVSHTAAEMKGMLVREFGRGFDISATNHYLVVHPAGQRDQWADRFEELYRSYVHYFSVRNTRPHNAQFPLVAIVLPDWNQFRDYASSMGVRVGDDVLGYYCPRTNRIVLYDLAARRNNVPWSVNAETIIHEATHQMAYNTGLHSRFAESPRWVVEGLGTMFEAPGVWNSRVHRSRDNRINYGRLADFRDYVDQGWPPNWLAQFIADDQFFRTHPRQAYASAWALTFYLSETHHQKYLELLTRGARRDEFSRYPAEERFRDFTDVFGRDLRLLEAHWLRFMDQL